MGLPINKSSIDSEVQDEAQDKKIDTTIINQNLNETELKIIKLLKNSELSKKEISNILGYSTITGNVKKAIQKLIAIKIIVYTIPDKPKSKNQKYKLVK